MKLRFVITSVIVSLLSLAPTLALAEDEHGHGKGGHEGHAHGEEEEDAHGHSDKVKLTPEVMKVYGIVVEKVTTRALVEPIVSPGWVMYDPETRALVGTIAPGRIIALPARLGDRVEAGQVLAEIASTEFGTKQNDYMLRRATIVTATTAREIAEQSYKRAQGLEVSGGLSLAEIQRREGDVKTARAQFAAAEAELLAAKNALKLFGMDDAGIERLSETGEVSSQLAIRAPIAGTVVERDVALGAVVNPDDKPLFIIADPSRLLVVANVPESVIGSVTVGSLATLAGFAGNELGEGDVSYVSPEIDAHTRSGRARIVVAGATSALKPGMYVQIRITSLLAAEGPQVTAVPEGAVVTFEGKSAVFVYHDDEGFIARPVTVGPALGGYIPVLTGLEPGERIAVKGAFMLKADLGKEGAGHDHAH